MKKKGFVLSKVIIMILALFAVLAMLTFFAKIGDAKEIFFQFVGFSECPKQAEEYKIDVETLITQSKIENKALSELTDEQKKKAKDALFEYKLFKGCHPKSEIDEAKLLKLADYARDMDVRGCSGSYAIGICMRDVVFIYKSYFDSFSQEIGRKEEVANTVSDIIKTIVESDTESTSNRECVMLNIFEEDMQTLAKLLEDIYSVNKKDETARLVMEVYLFIEDYEEAEDFGKGPSQLNELAERGLLLAESEDEEEFADWIDIYGAEQTNSYGPSTYLSDYSLPTETEACLHQLLIKQRSTAYQELVDTYIGETLTADSLNKARKSLKELQATYGHALSLVNTETKVSTGALIIIDDVTWDVYSAKQLDYATKMLSVEKLLYGVKSWKLVIEAKCKHRDDIFTKTVEYDKRLEEGYYSYETENFDAIEQGELRFAPSEEVDSTTNYCKEIEYIKNELVFEDHSDKSQKVLFSYPTTDSANPLTRPYHGFGIKTEIKEIKDISKTFDLDDTSPLETIGYHGLEYQVVYEGGYE